MPDVLAPLPPAPATAGHRSAPQAHADTVPWEAEQATRAPYREVEGGHLVIAADFRISPFLCCGVIAGQD